jgi:hypothetical protein
MRSDGEYYDECTLGVQVEAIMPEYFCYLLPLRSGASFQARTRETEAIWCEFEQPGVDAGVAAEVAEGVSMQQVYVDASWKVWFRV